MHKQLFDAPYTIDGVVDEEYMAMIKAGKCPTNEEIRDRSHEKEDYKIEVYENGIKTHRNKTY